MAINILRYPYDKTGVAASNKVVAEPHLMPRRRNRAVATEAGPFYTESVELIDAATLQPLVKGVDWYPIYYQEIPSKLAGKEVCSLALITNEQISDNVLFTYQAVGGEFSYSAAALARMIHDLDLDNRPVKWPDIINKDEQYNPAPHLHDAGDTYGWEYVVQSLERIAEAILMGDRASHDEILRYIDAALALLQGYTDQIKALLEEHMQDKENPHEVTRVQLNVYSIPEVNALLQNLNDLITARINQLQVDLNAQTQRLTNHILDEDNPHKTTAHQTGAFTQQETTDLVNQVQTNLNNAVATINQQLTTLTNSLAATNLLLNNHIANEANPHKTTAAQVGAYTKAEVDNILGTRYVAKTGDTMTGRLTGAVQNMSMSQDGGATQGSFVCRADGAGDGGVAGMTFYNNSYAIKMGVRNDGVMGWGGWSAAAWRFYQDAAGNATFAGDVTAYSDPRLKENISKIDRPMEKLHQLDGVYFNWKNLPAVACKAGTRDFGVLADQVQRVFPEAVKESIEFEGERYLTVSYDKLVAVLIEVAKLQDNRLQAVEKLLGIQAV